MWYAFASFISTSGSFLFFSPHVFSSLTLMTYITPCTSERWLSTPYSLLHRGTQRAAVSLNLGRLQWILIVTSSHSGKEVPGHPKIRPLSNHPSRIHVFTYVCALCVANTKQNIIVASVTVFMACKTCKLVHFTVELRHQPILNHILKLITKKEKRPYLETYNSYYFKLIKLYL